ncbi:uncharacterized protein LOC108930357 isoform X2 [Scleropages formosus]|uniref:uncharacterized protein LOC108930357 isoform X2 n=1 Tax=Scleropages formosus TaxID=113540 RepID=UPI0008791EF7|nr:uncharacterized protein LOC108930357 isoform X2 [Scleropages formosus]
MSSHAAAAISAMITSQVYPQPPRVATHTRQRSRSQELRPVASLPKGKVIGTVQVTIGIVLVGTFFVSVLNYGGLYREAQVASVVGCVVYVLSGLVSAFAKGQSGIKAAIFTNGLSSLTAFISIIIYCLCFQRCWDNTLSGAHFYTELAAGRLEGHTEWERQRQNAETPATQQP